MTPKVVTLHRHVVDDPDAVAPALIVEARGADGNAVHVAGLPAMHRWLVENNYTFVPVMPGLWVREEN